MREILFRGKCIYTNDWLEGYYFKYWNRYDLVRGTENGIPKRREVDPETVGQYTGLKDKNGKKIFEGDVLLHEDFSKGACITFNQYTRKSIVRLSDFFTGVRLYGLPLIKPDEIEIIGNIHDNPDLLL